MPLLAFKSAPPDTAQLHAAAATDHDVARRAPPTARRALRHARRARTVRRGHAPKTHDLEGVVRQARTAASASNSDHGRPVRRKNDSDGET